jgi:Domain of unknown function (DUF1883)
MKYLYWDLGAHQQHSRVVVHLHGSAANVLLLDPVSFDRYRCGLSFHCTGGLHTDTRRPARREIPRDGHWYLVIDCGGPHRVDVKKIQILRPKESPTASEADRRLAGATA